VETQEAAVEPASEVAAPVAELTADEQESVAAELLVEQTGETPVVAEAAAEVAAPVDTPTAEVAVTDEKAAPAEPTKKDRAIVIVKAGLIAGKARKDVIAQLRTELEMGVPGASTYFQNVKSKKWQ
jgi:hypothetical protein